MVQGCDSIPKMSEYIWSTHPKLCPLNAAVAALIQGVHLEVLLKQTFITNLYYVTKSNKEHHSTVHSGPFDTTQASNRFLHGLPHRRCARSVCPAQMRTAPLGAWCVGTLHRLSASMLPTKSSIIVFSWAMVSGSHLTTCAMTCD